MAVISSEWKDGRCVYRCTSCSWAGRSHQVVKVPSGVTDGRSCWGPGVPVHVLRCTACGGESGGWVSADDVGGGW